jgi:hypothetical protein
MELDSEHSADVHAAVAATERLIAQTVARGGRELLPLLADVRALLARPLDAKFRKALDELEKVFPYWQDRGATWTGRDDQKFLKRLRAAGGSYGETHDATVHEIRSSVDHIRYIFERAVRLATHRR